MNHATGTKMTLLLASSLTVMAGAIVSPSLPAIAHAFEHAPRAALRVKLVLTLPALAIALIAPLTGFIIDRFGRRTTLIASLLLYGIAGTTGLYLDALDGILLGRAFLGFAVAGVMTATTTLIGDYYHGEARSSLMSYQASAMAFGGVVFLVAGGQLANLSWRGPFAVYALSWLLLPLALAFLPEPARAGHTDAESATLVPPEEGDSERTPWGTLILNYSAGFAGMAAFYLVPVQIPFLLERMADASGATIGFAIAGITLTSGLSSLAYGRIRRRLGFYTIYAGLFAIMGAAYLLIGSANSLAGVVVGLLVGGLGGGLLMPNTNLCLLNAAPARLRGKLVGGLTATLFSGQFLSPILAEPAVRQFGARGAFLGAGVFLFALAVSFATLAARSRAAATIA